MSPLVSIITATHNRPRSLTEVIGFVRSQTCPDWEHLVVSDGFDPRIQRLVKEVRDPRIRYYFTRHHGYWGVLPKRAGLLQARGEMILYLDDDNTIEPMYLERMVSAFAQPETMYAVCHVRHHDGRILAPTLPPQRGDVDLLNFMIRRNALMAVGGFPDTTAKYSDFMCIERVAARYPGVIVPEVLGCHRWLEQPEPPPWISWKRRWWNRGLEVLSFRRRLVAGRWRWGRLASIDHGKGMPL